MQSSASHRKSTIVGAGIGGLTAALTLARRGWDVEVFEQSPRLTEVGAGLQISPNAVRTLQLLGLGGRLQETGFVPEGIDIRHWLTGQQLACERLGKNAEKRWGAPYYHIHRADLHQLLAEAVAAANIPAHLNSAATDLDHEAQTARLHLSDGRRLNADLLVGADGIHSRIREQLWGPAAARFTGHVAWRLLIRAADLPPGMVRPVASLWMGPGAHFVHYYVRGGEWVNCVCVIEQDHWQKESWTEAGSKDELLSAFAGWHGNIQSLLEAADPESCYRWALFDRNPLPNWSRHHTTLLGDACHPTLPFLAQGAAMAIEDATVLAECLTFHDSIPSALQRYEQLRKPRTSRVQLTSRRNGHLYHLRGPMAWLRNMALRSGLASTRRTANWLYSYEAANAVTVDR